MAEWETTCFNNHMQLYANLFFTKHDAYVIMFDMACMEAWDYW